MPGIPFTFNDVFRVGVLAALAVLLNAGILDGNWRWDDPQILLHLHLYSIVEDFINPEVWRQLSPANLTPWLILSFEIDLILFGNNPFWFYLHQLLAVVAAVMAFYTCLALWVTRSSAFFGALLFLLGAPLFLVLEQLMTRHYVEGLVFCLLSLILYVRYLRAGQRWQLGASVLFFVLALTAKEVYAPLFVLLPFLPEADRRRRLMALIPFGVVIVAYSLWRTYMLGTVSGGYVDSADYLSLAYIVEVARSFSRLPELLTGGVWPVFAVVYLTLLLSYAWLLRSYLPRVALVALLVLLPLVPLVTTPGIHSPDRYLLLTWLVLCFSVAFFIDSLLKKFSDLERAAPIVAIYMVAPVLLAGTLYHGLQMRNSIAPIAREFDVHAQFIEAANDTVSYVPSANILSSFWFATGLQDFKLRLQPQSSAPKAIVDPWFLQQLMDRPPTDPESGADKLFTYDASCLCMRDVSSSIVERYLTHQQLLRQQAALALDFAYQDGYFSWQFGPYTEGSYQVVSEVIGVIAAPASGRLRVTLPEQAVFYLRYTAPEGWTTYSDAQRIVHGAPQTRWRRDL